MAKTINTNIDDGFLLFTFTNKQGEVFSSFKLNPTDINVAARAEELETFFEQAQESVKNVSSSKEMAEINNQIEDKINYMLGYEASKDLFKEPITATTVFGNGQVFASILLSRWAGRGVMQAPNQVQGFSSSRKTAEPKSVRVL